MFGSKNEIEEIARTSGEGPFNGLWDGATQTDSLRTEKSFNFPQSTIQKAKADKDLPPPLRTLSFDTPSVASCLMQHSSLAGCFPLVTSRRVDIF
jgi:hypothetical protein